LPDLDFCQKLKQILLTVYKMVLWQQRVYLDCIFWYFRA